MQRLLLLYETRTFGSLAVYAVELDAQTFPRLDREILERFDLLLRQRPDQASTVQKLRSKYEFIRARLLNHELGWVPESAAHYIGQVVDGVLTL